VVANKPIGVQRYTNGFERPLRCCIIIIITIIIIVAKIKVTLSHKKMLQGHCAQVVVASRALVKCQLYSSSTVRPMFSPLEKTH